MPELGLSIRPRCFITLILKVLLHLIHAIYFWIYSFVSFVNLNHLFTYNVVHLTLSHLNLYWGIFYFDSYKQIFDIILLLGLIKHKIQTFSWLIWLEEIIRLIFDTPITEIRNQSRICNSFDTLRADIGRFRLSKIMECLIFMNTLVELDFVVFDTESLTPV